MVIIGVPVVGMHEEGWAFRPEFERSKSPLIVPLMALFACRFFSRRPEDDDPAPPCCRGSCCHHRWPPLKLSVGRPLQLHGFGKVAGCAARKPHPQSAGEKWSGAAEDRPVVWLGVVPRQP